MSGWAINRWLAGDDANYGDDYVSPSRRAHSEHRYRARRERYAAAVATYALLPPVLYAFWRGWPVTVQPETGELVVHFMMYGPTDFED